MYFEDRGGREKKYKFYPEDVVENVIDLVESRFTQCEKLIENTISPPISGVS